MASTKIIHGEERPKLVQPGQGSQGGFSILHQQSLRQLQIQVLRAQPGFKQYTFNVMGEIEFLYWRTDKFTAI